MASRKPIRERSWPVRKVAQATAETKTRIRAVERKISPSLMKKVREQGRMGQTGSVSIIYNEFEKTYTKFYRVGSSGVKRISTFNAEGKLVKHMYYSRRSGWETIVYDPPGRIKGRTLRRKKKRKLVNRK